MSAVKDLGISLADKLSIVDFLIDSIKEYDGDFDANSYVSLKEHLDNVHYRDAMFRLYHDMNVQEQLNFQINFNRWMNHAATYALNNGTDFITTVDVADMTVIALALFTIQVGVENKDVNSDQYKKDFEMIESLYNTAKTLGSEKNLLSLLGFMILKKIPVSVFAESVAAVSVEKCLNGEGTK